ncbi:MAG TPA: hypothetical protein V6D50_04345 [Chroococcales cyanobacterium]
MPAVEIILNPYQGLKQFLVDYFHISLVVEIILNPYQGLKHFIDRATGTI